MNNTINSTFYAFLATTALMTGTVGAMEENLNKSVILKTSDSISNTPPVSRQFRKKPIKTTTLTYESELIKLIKLTQKKDNESSIKRCLYRIYQLTNDEKEKVELSHLFCHINDDKLKEYKNKIYTNKRLIRKRINLKNQLLQFKTKWAEKEIEQTISHLKTYLNTLIEYKKLILNKKNSKQISEIIIAIKQQIAKHTENDSLSQATIFSVENNAPAPTKEELNAIFNFSPLSTLQAQETDNIGKNNSHYNSEENIQAPLIQNSPNQRRLSIGENTSPIEPNRVMAGLPVQPSGSSSMIDVLQQKIDPNQESVILQAVHAHRYDGETPRSPEEEPSDESQEENTNHSSNIWTSISNTLTSCIARILNSLWNLLGWFKFW